MSEAVITPQLARGARAGPWFLYVSASVFAAFLTLAGGLVLALGHRERMETGLFVVVFVVLIPAGLVLSKRRLLDVGEEASDALALVNVGGAALLVVIARCVSLAVGARPVPLVLLLGGSALIAADRLAGKRFAAFAQSRTSRSGLEIAAGALVILAVASFFPDGFYTVPRLMGCLVVGAGLSALYLGRVVISLGRAARFVIDAIVLVITLLAAPDIRPFRDLFRYDYDFFLGPANAIVHGHPMLVETFSQYGVGLPLALAGIFRVVPTTYGGLQAVLCVGYAIEFIVVYWILRRACRSQFLAILGLAVAMVATLVLPGQVRIAFPSIGPLRFGLPLLIILAGVLAAPTRSRKGMPAWVGLGALAVAAVWSFEALIYSAGAYLGIAAVSCAIGTGARARRLRAFADVVVVGIGVCTASVAMFTALTRWFVGTWPDWGTYLGLIGKYSVHEFGTLLIPSWSTGYAIAGVYVISSLGLAVVVAQPPSPRPKPAALAGIAGATAFGALSFTYFLGRSEPTNLHHLAIPAVITVCCWVDVLGCLSSSTRRFATITGTVIVAFVGAAVLTQSPTWTAAWINGSPLGQALRSPSTVATETRDLLRRQSLRPVVSESSRLLILYGRPGRPVAVLLRSDLLTDALLASETGNALPIVNGNQDRLNGEPSRALVRRSIARLAAGSYVLTENVFLRRPPASFSGKDPPIAGDKRYGDYFIALALADVLKQFNTEVVTRGSHGLVVLRLEPKTAGE